MKISKIKLLFVGLIIAFGATAQAKDVQLKTIPAEFVAYWEPVSCTESNCPMSFGLSEDAGMSFDDMCPGPLKSVVKTMQGNTVKLVVKAVYFMHMDCLKKYKVTQTDTFELQGKYLYRYEGKKRVGPYKRMKQ